MLNLLAITWSPQKDCKSFLTHVSKISSFADIKKTLFVNMFSRTYQISFPDCFGEKLKAAGNIEEYYAEYLKACVFQVRLM
jgi:hypothetical protein